MSRGPHSPLDVGRVAQSRQERLRRLSITPRQLDVLELLAKGLTNAEIASVLGISAATVKVHVAAIIASLDVSNRMEAAMALRDVESEVEHGGPGDAGAPQPRQRPPWVRVAVLPFANLSGEQDAYFADGITEEIISVLSKVPGLRAAARTSSFSIDTAGADAVGVARRLGVDFLVEGSVRRQPETLRIDVRLVGGADGFPLWSERFHGTAAEQFALQDEIASSVAVALQLRSSDAGPSIERHSGDAEACDLYWRARYFWNQRSPLGLPRAMQYFQQVLAREPAYALAHVGLADAYCQIGSYSMLPPAEAFEAARGAARAALAIHPDLGEAHASLAYVLTFYDRDFDAAEGAFQRAIALSPSYAFAYGWYALLCLCLGREEECLALSRRGQQLDPLSVPFATHLGRMLYSCQEYDRARAQLENSLELDAGYARTWSWLGLVHAQQGRAADAERCLARAVECSGGHPLMLAGWGYALARQGRDDEARRVEHQLRERAAAGHVSALYHAIIPIALGEIERAFEALEAADRERAPLLLHLTSDPVFAPLAGDPRYADLARRLGVARGGR